MPPLAIIWRASRGSDLLATHVSSIIEVLPPLSWRPVPGVPNWVRGLFAYRTRLIPLVDTAQLVGAGLHDDRMHNRVLVVRMSCGNVSVDWPMGLWVESVLDLDRVDFCAANSHPGFEVAETPYLGAVAQTRWGTVQLMEPERIFTLDQVRLLTLRMEELSGATPQGVGAS